MIEGIIKAVTGPKEYQGDLQIGFLLEDREGWINTRAEESALNDLLSSMVKKGNKIEFELFDGYANSFKLLEEAKEVPQSKEKGGKWEDDIVSFETLLNEAHDKFGSDFSITTELIEYNVEKKWAIAKATITISHIDKLDQVFQAYGDADQENCQSAMIKPHYLRMAETRSIARCLRWATNNAKTAEEEKGDVTSGTNGGENERERS